MRKLMKFLHTMGAIGMIGAMAALIVLMADAPPPTSLAGYALVHRAMGDIATWVFLPALVLTLVPGVFSLAINRAFHNAGWAWAKAGTGILVFEGSLMYVQGPIKAEAERSASALAGQLDPATLTGSYGAEANSMWLLLAVSLANVVLGVWRPRFGKRT